MMLLKRLKQKNGQAVLGEYVLLFFLVVAGITAMSVYMKRAIQGRLRDSRQYMQRMVLNTLRDQSIPGDPDPQIWAEYEPYYMNRVTDTSSTIYDEKHLLPSGPGTTSGIYRSRIDETKVIKSTSNQAPPKDAN
ncbi:MAG: hypothetical protein A2Z88_05985 [Omnitrophica WOR_2 bacterium GWA2_47_8]|nr:MAG: hypothetical protein A2Z88_05985 [Omnitrophica WOR_2 bacterium GWA2_47_8]